MVLLYMVTWIPSIYPLYVSIYTSTMDPMGIYIYIRYSFSNDIRLTCTGSWPKFALPGRIAMSRPARVEGAPWGPQGLEKNRRLSTNWICDIKTNVLHKKGVEILPLFLVRYMQKSDYMIYIIIYIYIYNYNIYIYIIYVFFDRFEGLP